MRKHYFTGLRPFVYAVTVSCLALQLSACGTTPVQSDTPTETPAPEITDSVATPLPEDAVTSAPEDSSSKGEATDITAPAKEDTDTPDTPVKEVPGIPQFSAEGGFYDQRFKLALSALGNNEIYYTTDGSDPRTSDTAVKYTKEIPISDNTDAPNKYSALTDISLSGYNPPQFNIDKGITIRAVCKTAEGDFGTVITNSYFVGKTASYYSEMKVVSMVTDSDYLFDEDTGIYMIGSKYYEWENSDDYVAYDTGDVRNVTNYNTGGRETEVPVSVQVFEEGKAVYSTDVGTRLSGNWSRGHAQKSFRLYARKEYGDGKMRYAFFDELTDINGEAIEKFDKVTLRNGGNDVQEVHFRDALIHDLTEDLAFDTMASEPCILFINGEFWGFYLIREKTDGDYIESHYGIKKEEVAVIKNSEVEEGTEDDLEEFREFCTWATSADMTKKANYEKFCTSMDVQSLMDYIAVETYINNNDWANGTSNNWMVWHSKTVNPELPKADGKWRFILFDTEFSTGLYGSEGTKFNYDLLGKMSVGEEDFDIPGIVRNLCKNDTFREAFYANYIHIMETCFDPELVNAKIDEYGDAYEDAVADTFYRFGMDWAAWNYDNEIEDLKSYFKRRPKYATRYLNAFCGVKEAENPVTDSNNRIKPTDTWGYYGDAIFRADADNNSFHVSVPRVYQNTWDIQSQAGGLTLEKGHEYLLSFDASSSASAEMEIFFNRQEGWNWPQCWATHVVLSQDMKHYEFRFVMESDSHDDWQLCLNFGKCTGYFEFRNVSLTQIK